MRTSLKFSRRVGETKGGTWVLLGFLLVGASSCDDSGALITQPVEVPSRAVLSEILTDKAFSALDVNGEFAPRYLTMPAEGTDPEGAIEMATGLVEAFAIQFRPTIEEGAERPVDFASLAPLPRVYFAETPYVETPILYPTPVRALLGPAYVVIFADRHGPVLGVTVSPHTTDYEVREGTLVFPIGKRTGNQFRFYGFLDLGDGSPIGTPEVFAKFVADATGARIASAPIFVSRGHPYGALIGAWRVELDREQHVRTAAGETRATTVLYVGQDRRLYIEDGIGAALNLRVSFSTESVRIPRRADLGSDLIAVTLTEAGSR